MGVENLMDPGFSTAFPTHPHNTFRCARSVWHPPLSSDTSHHYVVISWQLSSCLHLSVQKIHPELTIYPMIRLQNQSSTCNLGCPCATCTFGHPYVRVCRSLWENCYLPRSPITEHQIRQDVPPKYAPFTKNNKDPNPKAHGNNPLVHWPKPQNTAMCSLKLRRCKNTQQGPQSLTKDNSKLKQSTAPLQDTGSRTQAVHWGEPGYL